MRFVRLVLIIFAILTIKDTPRLFRCEALFLWQLNYPKSRGARYLYALLIFRRPSAQSLLLCRRAFYILHRFFGVSHLFVYIFFHNGFDCPYVVFRHFSDFLTRDFPFLAFVSLTLVRNDGLPAFIAITVRPVRRFIALAFFISKLISTATLSLSLSSEEGLRLCISV